MTSWRTTMLGVLGLISAAIQVAQAMMAGNSPDWIVVGAQIMTSLGLIAARDNKVTSEQAGLK